MNLDVKKFDEAIEKMLLNGDLEVTDLNGEFEDLLKLGQGLNALPDPDVSTHSMMTSLASAVADEKYEKKCTLMRYILPVSLLGRAASICVISFIIGWGTLSASANSIPGDMTYSVKKISEQIRMFLAFGEEGRVELQISFSEARMNELIQKFEKDKVIHFGLVRAMLKHAEDALVDQGNIDEASRKEWLHRIDFLLISQQKVLKDLEESCSDPERDQLTAYITQCGCSKQELDEFKKKLGMPCLCHLGNGKGCGCQHKTENGGE